jgi:predicted DNA-binding transcriptional regulator AlpA
MMNASLENYIPFNYAMQKLGCSKHFLYKLMNEGKIRKSKVGKKCYLRVDDIANLLEESEVN